MTLDRKFKNGGSLLISVLLLLLVVLPLVLAMVRQAILNDRLNLRSRALAGSRSLSQNSLADYMRQFSTDYRADFYQTANLIRMWDNSGLNYSGVGISSPAYNSLVDATLTYNTVRTRRICVLRNKGIYRERATFSKSQLAVIQFQSDVARFGLMSYGDLGLPNDNSNPLRGQSLSCGVWVGGNLDVTGPLAINGPYNANTFTDTGVAVVNGNVTGGALTIPLGAQLNYSGTVLNTGAVGGRVCNYVPAELNSFNIAPVNGMNSFDPFDNLAYYINHRATMTVVGATVAFTNNGVSISYDDGGTWNPFAIDNTQGAIILGNGAPLYLKKQAGENVNKKIVVATIGSSITIGGDLNYLINLSRALVVLSGIDLVFTGNGNETVCGLFYARRNVVINKGNGNTLTINGTLALKGLAGLQTIFTDPANPSILGINVNNNLRSSLPQGIPEKASIAEVRQSN